MQLEFHPLAVLILASSGWTISANWDTPCGSWLRAEDRRDKSLVTIPYLLVVFVRTEASEPVAPIAVYATPYSQFRSSRRPCRSEMHNNGVLSWKERWSPVARQGTHAFRGPRIRPS